MGDSRSHFPWYKNSGKEIDKKKPRSGAGAGK
jgi:hypothetical protein